MSTSRGSGAGNGGGAQPIPLGSRKMVQSLREIVNCSEAEIYAALKECNMDPNEAVNRLLCQDPFHEVKSKREKKKEGKDASDSRSRGANNNSSRANKIGADRYAGRGGSTPYNSSESAPLPGKSSYKKENGLASYASSPGMSGNSRSRGPASLSNGAPAENKGSLLGTADAMPSGGVQPTSGYHPTWTGAPSMADIVKMGRPHNRASTAPKASNSNVLGPSADVSHHNLMFPEDHASKDADSGISSIQPVTTDDEWPIIEKPAATKVISNLEYDVHPEHHLEESPVSSDSINQYSEADEVQEAEDEQKENSGANVLGSDSISSRTIPEDDSRGESLFENDLYKHMGSYQNQAHEFHTDEELGAPVSSVARNLEQLSVEKDERGLPSEECAPSVVIPDHLQVQNADCSHLSFGSFGSGLSTTYSSGTVTSVPVRPNLEEAHDVADVTSVGPSDTRSAEYYVDDSLRNASNSALFHGTGASAGSYDTPSVSQPEELKPDNAEVTHGNQYPFPSPNPGYTFDDAQRLNATFSQTSSQMQNLSPFSTVMQSYTNSLSSNLSPANAHPGRESDLQYSPFPVPQSMPSKYGNAAIGGSAITMSEVLKTAGLSSTQPAPHALSGATVATGPPLPQHLSVHPYSQPTLPLGPFTNMFGYPFLPQSYTYMPSGFQQTFAGNSTYHQSLAALLPQFKNNASASSLPQSAAIASGYGALGNAATIPGNFPMNPPSVPSATTLSYDDVLSSQYKDSIHLASLQQSENSAMWLHGPNSRTMSAVPGSTYNFQGHNKQSGGLRQGQQLSQNYGALGYPNFYHSQTGVSLDQQQNPRDGPLGGPQGQPKQSQIWQNSY